MSTIVTPSYSSLVCAKPATRSLRPSSLASLKKSSKQIFGSKSSFSSLRVSAMAEYNVKLISPEGEEREIRVQDDQYILDVAEENGIELPYSCRAGSCCTCTGKLVSGTVDQSEGAFLDEEQMGQGYALLCISYPRSDCVIHTHKEEEVH